MRLAGIERVLRQVILAGAIALIIPAVGCGGANRSAGAETPATKRHCKKLSPWRDEYMKILCEFRDAAIAHEIYDAYGYAEYIPAPQRAALHAFCLVVNRNPERLEAEALSDRARLANEIVATARSEVDFGRAELGSMAALRRAIARLQAILGSESVGRDLSEHYAKACY